MTLTRKLAAILAATHHNRPDLLSVDAPANTNSVSDVER
jgi:hypothetical protein